MEADSDATSSIASIDSDDSNNRQKKALRVIQAAASAVLLITQPYVDRSLCRTSMSGSAYIDELLESGHPQRCFEVLRMSLDTFIALRDCLLQTSTLSSSRGLLIEEKLAIFLHIVGRGASNRDTQERFSHSGETVSR
jgi:hypothetical protein